MARRKKGNPVHGWLVLDKPLDMTSTQAVGDRASGCSTRRRRATPARSIRWPPAFCRSRSARRPRPSRSPSMAQRPIASPCAGARRPRPTTPRGAVRDVSDVRPTLRCHRGPAAPLHRRDHAGAAGILGDQDRRQPRLRSRPRRRGRHARAAAVVIDSLRIVDMPDDDTTVFEAECGKGTYVRAVARDMGRILGCYGHVIALRRTRVGPFTEEMSVPLDHLREDAESGEISHDLLPVETALGDMHGARRQPVRRRVAVPWAGGADPRPRRAGVEGGGVRAVAGPADRARRDREGRTAPDARLQSR